MAHVEIEQIKLALSIKEARALRAHLGSRSVGGIGDEELNAIYEALMEYLNRDP